MRRALIPACALLLTSLSATTTRAEGLSLAVENIRNDIGTIVVLVFDDAEAFDHLAYEWAVGYAALPARPGTLSHTFADLTSGPYAVFLFHDENGDWDVNHRGNRLLEGVGASGAPNPDDMPDFAAASVRPGPVTIPVHYDR